MAGRVGRGLGIAKLVEAYMLQMCAFMEGWLGVVAIAAGCGDQVFVSADARSQGDARRLDGSQPVGCWALPPTCGPAGTSSCCTSPLVHGGMFFRGYDVGSDGMFSDMSFPATVSDFR